MKCVLSVLSGLVLFLFMGSVRAEIIAAWEVSGLELDDGTHLAPFVVAAHTAATHMAMAEVSLSYSVNRSTTADKYGFKISDSYEQTSLAGAIAAGHYMEFTLATDDDYAVTLNTLEIRGESTGSGCDNIAVLSDVGGFAEDQAIAGVSSNALGTWAWGFDPYGGEGYGDVIELSDPAYSNLESVVFRIYGWNSSSGSGCSRIYNVSGYDVIFSGTVAPIPVVGSLMIIK